MNTFSSTRTYRRHPFPFYLAFFSLLSALILSIISFKNICTTACEAAHSYKLFGMSFEAVGIPFFSLLLLLHLTAWRSRFFSRLKENLIAASLGAEIVFIAIQKLEMGHWCPLCLAIAATILLTAIALAWENQLKHAEAIKISNIEEEIMNRHPLSLLAAALAGFALAFMGISQENPLEAVEKKLEEKIVFGNNSSPVEVFIFTDWFCPPCRKIEPTLEKAASAAAHNARLVFVDMGLHPESRNFIPYNISFMINNKPKYFKLREILSTLSEKTTEPKEKEVKEAAGTIGEKYYPMTFSETSLGLDYFQELSKKFNIEGTPTVIVYNTSTHQEKKLEGVSAITEENILSAIEELQGSSK